ncbi:MAG: sigma-70 family RNA polymerase sigma factor [Candidatus Kapabacteria bacterium]|nr:sigma-70 family RNA polymerase sigma factor [Candidatus Kapabacteria bacterium]
MRVARLRSGDPSVMSELYDAYSPALYGVVLRILRSQTHAEDILQETFVRVWTKRDTYADGKGSLFTWMLNIARNLAIDTLRSASFNTVGIQTDDSSVGIGEQSDDPRPRGDTLDLKKFVNTLPSEQQEIIELVYFKGFTQSEIADERGIPLGTVKSRLRLAMNTLRTIYGVPS